ncbi:HAMP domain-containing histidine kinase [Aliiroseovarius sp. Z3]|uniref:sensor histidine kinase n=1 Tax=Aliiroseovarius sp. Z3 TaxID=2811402 RepID=UPI0023B3422E|nr:HAMP domain-containing sensor histidine kinase [Aliiroseovarius sp. Z3]MDE9451546.1 HAMP domain-containing histidine kinase [Aliiroseovarius sp. Z3]
MIAAGSLSRRVALLTSAGFAAIWFLAVVATATALKWEQEELLNLQLREMAEVFRPVLAKHWRDEGKATVLPPADLEEVDEAPVYVLVDNTGKVLLSSPSSEGAVLPQGVIMPGYIATKTHVFYATEPDDTGLVAIFGDPILERKEAYRDSFRAFLVPMLALLPLVYVLVGWIARVSLQPIERLQTEIAARGEGRLDPIDAAGQHEELRGITASTNALMIRLQQALDGERAFATNAAHELRTPVAIALAQTQRLRLNAKGDALDKVDRIEAALTRMSRLVARLLQLARADAGVGLASEDCDIRDLLDHVLEESRRSTDRSSRLKVTLPETAVYAAVDPDAFAILAGNLIDNAFQHSPAHSSVTILLEADGCLRIQNEGSVIDQATLAFLTQRHHKSKASEEGFGIGLHIAKTIARQCGGKLDLYSPIPGFETGFEARFHAP